MLDSATLSRSGLLERVLRTRPGLLAMAVFFAAFVAGARVALWLALVPGTGISLWVPSGLCIATLLATPRASWPWWLLLGAAAELVANALWFHNPVGVALLLHAGNALTALTGALLVQRYADGGRGARLDTLGDVVRLIGLGAVVAPMVAATIGAATLAGLQGQAFPRAWLLWWLGDATGVLIVAPLVLVALRWRAVERRPRPRRAAEFVALAALLAGLSLLSLGGDLPFAYIVMPAVLWAGVRFQFEGAVLAIVVLSLATVQYTLTGVSPFSGGGGLSPAQRQVMLQLFLSVSALSALVVAGVARQRRLALLGLRAANDQLEQRVAERTAELHKSEQRFGTLADAVPLSIWVTTPDGRIAFVNREFERFFGMSEETAQQLGWAALVHDEDRPALTAAYARARDDRTEFRVVARLRRADGEWRYLAAQGVPRLSETGEFLGMVGSTDDVTERKRYEDALAETARQKDEFLAMLAHELRNPLAPIRNAALLLRRVGATDPTLELARNVIERQVDHMARLVDDLLDVSRVSQGKIILRRRAVDLALVVRHAVESSQPVMQARDHQVDLEVPDAPVWVDGDDTRLAQALGNLLSNAAKYTSRGGHVRVSLAVDAPGPGAQATVRVRDNGRGIAPTEIAQVFQMFYQAQGTLDRAEGGLGIGLALVKRLVEKHGGRVEAHSAGLGQGSEFVIRLPVLDGPQPGAAPSPLPRTAPRPLRVLLVEDNLDAAGSLAMLLGLDGHEVLLAHDGSEALEVALREQPAVVLLDLGLPVLDGYASCRAMREAGLRSTLIVALTGYGRDEDRRRAQDAGFDAHLVKPVDPARLDELLRSRAAD